MTTNQEKEKDIVCGKLLDEIRTTSTYKNKGYGFCSNKCKIEFEKNPEKYIYKQC